MNDDLRQWETALNAAYGPITSLFTLFIADPPNENRIETWWEQNREQFAIAVESVGEYDRLCDIYEVPQHLIHK